MSRTWKHSDLAVAKFDKEFAEQLWIEYRYARHKSHVSQLKFCRCTYCTYWRTQRNGSKYIRSKHKGWRHSNKQYLHTGEYEKVQPKLGLGYLA